MNPWPFNAVATSPWHHRISQPQPSDRNTTPTLELPFHFHHTLSQADTYLSVLLALQRYLDARSRHKVLFCVFVWLSLPRDGLTLAAPTDRAGRVYAEV